MEYIVTVKNTDNYYELFGKALLTKAKMQVYSYLLVDNYNCVLVADILMYV